MIRNLTLYLAATFPAIAETGEPANGSEPASFFLLVLGLVALLIGTRNLRELRTKRMAPPRAPRQRGKHATGTPARED